MRERKYITNIAERNIHWFCRNESIYDPSYQISYAEFSRGYVCQYAELSKFILTFMRKFDSFRMTKVSECGAHNSAYQSMKIPVFSA